MEQLHSELCVLLCAVKLQAVDREDLRMVVATIDSEVATVECRLEQCHRPNGGLLALSISAVRNGPAGEDGTVSTKGTSVSGPCTAGDSTSAGLPAESGTMNSGVRICSQHTEMEPGRETGATSRP